MSGLISLSLSFSVVYLSLDELGDDVLGLLVGLGDGHRLVQNEIEQPGFLQRTTNTQALT